MGAMGTSLFGFCQVRSQTNSELGRQYRNTVRPHEWLATAVPQDGHCLLFVLACKMIECSDAHVLPRGCPTQLAAQATQTFQAANISANLSLSLTYMYLLRLSLTSLNFDPPPFESGKLA